MQLAMRDSVFEPLPAQAKHYVPVLQSKKGELAALEQVAGDDWMRMTPVICMVGDRVPPVEITDSRVSSWTRRVAGAVSGNVFYADVVRLKPETMVATTKGQVNVLARIHDRLRRRGCLSLPVYQAGWRSGIAAEAVRDAHDVDGRGCGLRLQVGDSVSVHGRALSNRASTALAELGVEAIDVDLIVDLGFLQPDSEPDIEGLSAEMAELWNVAEWRNLVCVATTMPASLNKELIAPGTAGLLPRHERALFRGLRDALPNSVPLTYGDYAVQHPSPPVEKGGPGMYPNIRYTASEATVVIRGREPVLVRGNAEYPEMCRILVGHRDYSGRGFTWGDELIASCGEGNLKAGGTSMWRGAGTSHHVRQVLTELAAT